MLKWNKWGDDGDRPDDAEGVSQFGCLMTANDEMAPCGSYQVEEDGSVTWATDLAEGVEKSIEDAMEMVERKMMCYPLDTTKPATGRYDDKPYKFGETMTVRRFRKHIKDADFTNSDGHGRPMRGKKLDSECLVKPSTVAVIPEDATHIQWYNK